MFAFPNELYVTNSRAAALHVVRLRNPPRRRYGLTPFEYLNRYHTLVVNDSRLGINVTANIQNYRPLKSEKEKEKDKEKIKSGEAVSSVPIEWEKQKQAVLDQVAVGLKLRRGHPVPERFILDDDRIGTSQVFYRASIRRAFDGRASPDDMIDTVRLAVWGKLTKPIDARLYMEKWFGQDCNAFVSNYLGVGAVLLD